MNPRAIKDLAQLNANEFIKQISIGLDNIHENCSSLYGAFEILVNNKNVRGSRIIEALIKEEASKYLILIDAIRCPWDEKDQVLRHLTKFNSHLAKHLYVEISSCLPATYGEVIDIIKRESQQYFLDGPNGSDWIFRNNLLSKREEMLYVDYVQYSDNTYAWITPKPHPKSLINDPSFLSLDVKILKIINSLHSLGLSDFDALKLFSENWQHFNFSAETHFRVFRDANMESLNCLEAKGLLKQTSNNARAIVIEELLFPLYKEKLTLNEVPLEKLREIQDCNIYNPL